jgi:hypothetical protein
MASAITRCAAPGSLRAAHRVQLQDVAAARVEARHQEHRTVNDAPGQVAAERGKQHGPHLRAARSHDSERAGEGQGHDQPEQDFRDPLHRIEHPIRQPVRSLHSLIDRHCDCPYTLAVRKTAASRPWNRLAIRIILPENLRQRINRRGFHFRDTN